jgi:hypothetical protein
MFVNFSNHPSRYWDNKQREASLNYGELFDMPFPQIAPNASDEELLILAQDCVDKIASLGDSKSITVHIMGEMTFTFMVVTRLKEMGIKCIASTTERKTTYNDDGTKVSEFTFVKFREY